MLRRTARWMRDNPLATLIVFGICLAGWPLAYVMFIAHAYRWLTSQGPRPGIAMRIIGFQYYWLNIRGFGIVAGYCALIGAIIVISVIVLFPLLRRPIVPRRRGD